MRANPHTFIHTNPLSNILDPPLKVLYAFRDTVLHGKDADLSYQTNSDILDNVTQAMSKAFPGKPVYATFGNHDYYPTDQFPPHNNELYNDTLLRWSNWIMEPTENSNFRKGNLCLGLASRLSNLSTVSNSKNGNDWLLADTCPQAANHCALF